LFDHVEHIYVAKTNGMMQGHRLTSVVQQLVIATKDPDIKNMYFFASEPDYCRRNMVEFPQTKHLKYPDSGEMVNPTEKRVELEMWLISHFSPPGARVVSVCSGTGTTAVACVLLGREHCILIDSDSKQMEFARDRFVSAGKMYTGPSSIAAVNKIWTRLHECTWKHHIPGSAARALQVDRESAHLARESDEDAEGAPPVSPEVRVSSAKKVRYPLIIFYQCFYKF
jgi:hypothetical protein